MTRLFKVELESTVTPRSRLDLKARRPGRKRPFKETISGSEESKSTGQWMQKNRVIDRDNDHYFERVFDEETGEVVHECEEPLSQHWGHGSAKPAPSDDVNG